MTPEQIAISSALSEHMSSNRLMDMEAKIVAKHGRAVYDTARHIIEESINQPMDWSRDTMEDGLSRMAAMHREKYPWLSADARSALAFIFTFTWK
ncbi:MAG: hypothetical protein Q8R82_21410 [Hyphomonadaceae bacterium]|nr:hypothetical protein [Hyphomonadaceae bacterium]